MNRAFIRVLYGDKGNPEHDSRNMRSRIDRDINNILKRENQADFYTYVFGEDNYRYMINLGCKNVILANKDSYIHKKSGNYVNKMYGWEYAMKDFDEIVCLDWDTVQTSPIPDNFWDVFYKKQAIQSPLYKCRRRVCSWRTDYTKKDNKRGISGCFIYMRDKKIPSEILKLLNDPVILDFRGSYSDETYVNMYTDILGGGWRGMHKYFDLFEPPWCIVEHTTFLEDKKDACFKHPVKG